MAALNRVGGAAERGKIEEDDRTLVEIVEVPLDTRRYVNFVRDSGAGAIATFEGTTRDTFEGKRVVELRYEAYVPMALRTLRSVCSAARASWEVKGMAVAHRLGRVGVGEASVFVAVSAEHRAAAMEACWHVIDELKASVPIWKKEVYEGGEVWKENPEFLRLRLRRSSNTNNDDDDDDDNPSKLSCCCGGAKVRVDDDHGDQDAGDGGTI